MVKLFMSLTLISLVVLTTAGFSWHSHHCSHKNQISYSFLIQAESCTCSEIVVSSCCSSIVNDQAHDVCDDGCCTDSKEFAKLDVQTLQFVYDDVLPDKMCLECLNLSLLTHNKLSVEYDGSTLNSSDEEPPPLSLPVFLSTIQVYLI